MFFPYKNILFLKKSAGNYNFSKYFGIYNMPDIDLVPSPFFTFTVLIAIHMLFIPFPLYRLRKPNQFIVTFLKSSSMREGQGNDLNFSDSKSSAFSSFFFFF